MTDPSESHTAANKFMSCKKPRVAAAICCTCFILIPGIICLLLYLLGYFTFQDPAIGLSSVTVTSVEFGYDGDAGPVFEFLNGLTNGTASESIPSQVKITMEMIVEINNTNAYDIHIQQSDENGTVVIPACIFNVSSPNCDNVDDMTIPTESKVDLTIATWEVPDTDLEANSSTEVPVSVTFTIDFSDGGDLAGLFASGGPLELRIQGGIKATSWVPGLAVMIFMCNVEIDDIHRFQDAPRVQCRQSTDLGKLIISEGNI